MCTTLLVGGWHRFLALCNTLRTTPLYGLRRAYVRTCLLTWLLQGRCKGEAEKQPLGAGVKRERNLTRDGHKCSTDAKGIDVWRFFLSQAYITVLCRFPLTFVQKQNWRAAPGCFLLSKWTSSQHLGLFSPTHDMISRASKTTNAQLLNTCAATQGSLWCHLPSHSKTQCTKPLIFRSGPMIRAWQQRDTNHSRKFAPNRSQISTRCLAHPFHEKLQQNLPFFGQ